MLDNVEILAMGPGFSAYVGELQEQPAQCIEGASDCYASGSQCLDEKYNWQTLDEVTTGVKSQDQRNFYKYCVEDVMCCGVGSLGGKEKRVYEATLSDINETESDNYYAKDFDQCRYWTLCRSLNSCTGDLDEDGIVNGSDLTILLSEWGLKSTGKACLRSDLQGDGAVGGADLAILLAKWGSCL
jgi:hypothetical protein